MLSEQKGSLSRLVTKMVLESRLGLELSDKSNSIEGLQVYSLGAGPHFVKGLVDCIYRRLCPAVFPNMKLRSP